MAQFRRPLLKILLFISLINLISADKINPSDVLFENVETTIDLSTQNTKSTIKITAKNTGKSQLNYIHYTIEENLINKLSFVQASMVTSSNKKYELQMIKLSDEKTWKIVLKKPLEIGGNIKIELQLTLTHELEPFPKEIVQQEKQLVKFTGNVYLYTPYTVTKQVTKVILPSKNIRSYSKIKAHSLKDTVITYQIGEKTGGFSREDFMVHFENNNKFLTVTKMERLIEVSHWGNIAVEETIDLLHTGALLKGSFSRYEYSMQHGSGQPSVQSFDTILPAAAADIYYRDEIGNISTSHIRVKKTSVDVNLRPRFPLFGGWKTHYVLGYNLPSYEYLFYNNNEFVLNMRLIDHVFDDMAVDELVVKIVLPEGANNFKLETPYQTKQLPETLHYSYLDTTGRPVITITKNNLVENHIQNFKLKYHFTKFMMFQEPLLVVTALYLLFLMVVVYVRLDFSIEKKNDEVEGEPEKKNKKVQ